MEKCFHVYYIVVFDFCRVDFIRRPKGFVFLVFWVEGAVIS